MNISANIIIKCNGPAAYSPCGREFRVLDVLPVFGHALEILQLLHSGWLYVDSKVMCPWCAEIYLVNLIPKLKE